MRLLVGAGGEEGDEKREADDESELEDDLSAIAEKDFGATGKEGRGLCEQTGGPHFGWGFAFVFLIAFLVVFLGRGGAGEHLVLVVFAMLFPRALPIGGVLLGEGGIDLFGVVDGEVVGHAGRGAMVGDAPFVQDEQGVVELQVGEGMGHRDDGAFVGAGKVVKEMHDFSFGVGVEAGSDFVAEKEFGGGDQFHSETESPLLTPGKNAHGAVGNLGESGFGEDTVETLVEFGGGLGLDAQAGGGLDGLVDGEFVVGDGELGHVANFVRFKVLFFGQIPSVVGEGAFGLGVDAGDGLEKSGLSAARGSHDGHEVSGGDFERNLIEQGMVLAVLGDVEREV